MKHEARRLYPTAAPAAAPVRPRVVAAPAAREVFPETVEFDSGLADGAHWGRAQTHFHAPIETVWRAIKRSPEATVDRRRADWWQVTPVDQGPWGQRYVVHNEARHLVTIGWVVAWRWTVVTDNDDGVEMVAGRFVKASGTTFIKQMDGNIVLREVHPGVTEAWFIENLSASRCDAQTIRVYAQDVLESLRAIAAGADMPDLR